MSEVLPADRSRLLRSKQAESSRIVTSRKRKLREFFAVCDNSEPIPTLDLADIDVQPTNDAEKEFLDACDISQNRLFDEAKLPARRNLRSNSSKQQSPSRIVSPEPRTLDASRKVTKSKAKDASKKSRATSPVSKVDEQLKAGLTNSKDSEEGSANGTRMQRLSSKGSQTDLPAKSAAVVDEIVKETFENEAEKQPSPAGTPVPTGVFESVKIATRVESPPGSPGVDPSKTALVSADEAGQLPESLVDRQLTSDNHHQAATIHLSPREAQEQRLGDLKSDKTAQEQQKEQPGKLSINLPSRDGGRGADALSSPGSTSHSATTPAYHEASTDTSPDNENHQYEADRLDDKDDKDENPETPSEMRPIPEDISEKEEHDRVSAAQLDPSDAVELLRSSPAAVDAQIRSEEQAAVNSTEAAQDAQMQDSAVVQTEESAGLTKEAGDVVEEIVEDVEEVVTVPTAAEEPVPVPQINEKQLEVADSEDGQTPVDNMDVDVTTVKDSFETNPSTASAPALSPAAHSMEVTEKSAETPQEPPAPSPAPPTPQRTPSASAIQPPPLERMTTRVASGAIKHKSVSEIIGERVLGESPRPNTGSSSERSTTTKGPTDSASAPPGSSPSRSVTPATPARARGMAERTKERERSKLSTVVFPKKHRKVKSDDLVVRVNGNWELPSGSDDYFLPMHQARPDVKTIQPTEQLLSTAHKTVTTSNMFLPHMEGQIVRVLGRIKELQAQHKWSLRQPKRSREPNRPGSHWDVLLQEMKWMRTDFREERKWKMVVAKNLATDCAEWKEASPEDQKLLQVNAKSPSLPPKKRIIDGVLETVVVNSENSEDAEMADVASSQAHPTPDLVASGMDSDSFMEDLDEEPRLDLLQTVAPTAIFGLQDDDVVFGLRRSPGSDKLLEELPMYSAPLTVPTGRPSLEEGDFDPDAAWRLPILPLSKYVEGRIELKNNGPPQKTSRFDYEDESDDEDLETFGQPPTKRVKLTPEMTCVALFNPEYRHIRDRIHAGHQFRPPTEFPMPNQSFFECRTASQWTPAEDDELKTLVREYTYNWSLISSVLTSKSMYSSGAERRTPWECFERWISLEGLPSDMQKTHYFKQYNNRMELAQRALLEQAAMQPPQPNANGAVTPARRRHTTSISVPRRRNQKHLTLVDAMRKQAKKRETTAQKQQHAASLAAMRKANEVPQPRAPAHTPQDFSRLKHEREVQMQERLHRYQQQQDAVRRQAMAARNPQMPQPGGAPHQVNRGPMPPNGPNGPNGQPIPIPNPNQLAVPGQNRPRMPMAPNPMAQPMQNGLQVPQIPQMPMNGVPQAQMQAIGRLPVPNPQLDINQISQARRIAEQQRQAVQMQQQGQQHPGQPNQTHNSPPNMRQANMNNMPQQPYPNMMPPFSQNPHAVSTPPPNGQGVHTPGSAGSPRMGYPVPQMLPHGGNTQNHSTMEAQIRQKFPNITQDQVTTMIRENVKQMQSNHQRQLSQSAMAAAAGGGNMNGGNGNGNGNGGHQTVPNGLQSNPQMYAQMLREQQRIQQQQALQAPGNGSPVQQQQQPQPQPQSQSQPQQQNQQNQQNQQTQQQQQVPRSGSAGSNGGNGASMGVSGNGNVGK